MADATDRGVQAGPLRIVEIETFGHGGLIHYAYNLSCALAGAGHDVTLVTAAGYELGGRLLPTGVTVRPIIARRIRHTPAWLPSVVRRGMRKVEALVDAVVVTAVVFRLRPDVVHLHSTNQIALAYLILLRLCRLRVAVTAHVVMPHERSRRLDAVHRAIHRLSPLIIAHSEFDRQRLVDECAISAERVIVLPHGEYGFFERESEPIDPTSARRSLGLDARAEAALFFGYIREYKGLDLLLDAWPAIAAARPKARLIIAGDAARLDQARRDELLAAADEVGAIHHFAYVPFAEVTRYFAAADVLVLPYRRVSQSGVLLLALAVGVPVVATRVGALAEMLRDGESALLVEPDSPEALAEAVSRVLGDAALRSRLIEGGREVAARASWPSIAGSTASAFARLSRPLQPGV